MGVFRKRHVFRENLETRPIGSASIVSATASAFIVFGLTASGSTPGSSADATFPIAFSMAPITEVTLEVSASPAVVLGMQAAGLSVSRGSANLPLALSCVARADAIGNFPISFGCTATVGSIFTMDAAPALVFALTAEPAAHQASVSPLVSFGFDAGSGELSGGTVEVAATAPVALAFAATGSLFDSLPMAINFSFDASAVRTTNYRTPVSRCFTVPRRDRRT